MLVLGEQVDVTVINESRLIKTPEKMNKSHMPINPCSMARSQLFNL